MTYQLPDLPTLPCTYDTAVTTVDRQVYELPPQPGSSQPQEQAPPRFISYPLDLKVITTSSSTGGDQSSPLAATSPGLSVTSSFSGPPLEIGFDSCPAYPTRARSASGISGVSDASSPVFRHDPYADTAGKSYTQLCEEEEINEIYTRRTPTPPPVMYQNSWSDSPRPCGSPVLGGIPGVPPVQFNGQAPPGSWPTPPANPTWPVVSDGRSSTPPYSLESFQIPADTSATEWYPVCSTPPPCQDHLQPMPPSPCNYSLPVDAIAVEDVNNTISSGEEGQPEEARCSKKQQKKSEAKGPQENTRKTVMQMTVRFKHGRCGEYYGDITNPLGAYVIIEGQRGQDLGVVTAATLVEGKSRSERRRHRVRRLATEEEVRMWSGQMLKEEEQALAHMQQAVLKNNTPIVIHRAEYQFDRKKLTFHYTPLVSHPDFRSILHDAFRQFKVRIWMNNCNPSNGEPGERIDLSSPLLPVYRG